MEKERAVLGKVSIFHSPNFNLESTRWKTRSLLIGIGEQEKGERKNLSRQRALLHGQVEGLANQVQAHGVGELIPKEDIFTPPKKQRRREERGGEREREERDGEREGGKREESGR